MFHFVFVCEVYILVCFLIHIKPLLICLSPKKEFEIWLNDVIYTLILNNFFCG